MAVLTAEAVCVLWQWRTLNCICWNLWVHSWLCGYVKICSNYWILWFLAAYQSPDIKKYFNDASQIVVTKRSLWDYITICTAAISHNRQST